jgi:3-deoxy-D-manno-octulosonate 8-phosphate phosphatase (KDO 8-P phosphatase)
MSLQKNGKMPMFKLWILCNRLKKNLTELVILVDVDGVLTDGTFYYGESGKVMKRFGPHDSEAAHSIKAFFPLTFISADVRGSEITRKRLSDMGFELSLCSSTERANLVERLKTSGRRVLFLGDSITDLPALLKADFSICPNDSLDFVASQADFRLKTPGGKGTLAELYLILKRASKGVDDFDQL